MKATDLDDIKRRLLADRLRRARGGETAEIERGPLADLESPEFGALKARFGSVDDVWPLSALQLGLVYQVGVDADATELYTVRTVNEVNRVLYGDRVRRALQSVVDSTAALRTAFVTPDGGMPVQVVLSTVQAPLTVVDLGSCSASEIDQQWNRILTDDRQRSFDIVAPPLFRVTLVHFPDGVDRLLTTYWFGCFDGGSSALLVSRVLEQYDGASPNLDHGYREYLRWSTSRDRAESERAWQRWFGDVDTPTLVAESGRGGDEAPRRVERRLSQAVSGRLDSIARESGSTLFTVLAAAWAGVLMRISGRSDVVFGTAVAGRPMEVPGSEHAIGAFISTVPLRVTAGGSDTVAGIAARVQDQRLDLMAHDTLGLGGIQKAIGAGALFDTLLVLRNAAGPAVDTGAPSEHRVRHVSTVDGSEFPVSIAVDPGSELNLSVTYLPDSVDDDRARYLLDSFENALKTVAEQPDLPISQWPSPAAESVSIVDNGFDDRLERLGDSTIAELLADRAASMPDATALVFGAERVTFGDLDARIGACARALLRRGAGPERIVALALPRSVEMVVALFAVLRTGSAYLPLELDYPSDRLDLMLADALPTILVTTTETQARGLTTDATEMIVDDPAVAAELAELVNPSEFDSGPFAPGTPGRLEHPAYVIYTSGSTGTPKGVVTPYRGLTNMQINHRDEIFVPTIAAAGDRTLRIAHTVSFSFDMSWEELLWLVEGHEVHVCDEELRRDGEALARYCEQNLIDVVNVTPTYAGHLLDLGLLNEHDGHRIPLVLLGGEAVPDSLWQQLGGVGYNLYGPTEYTINALGAGTRDSDTPSIGAPILGTRAYVLDQWLRPVPVGSVGELHLSGVGLARGYLHRYAQTATSFVADPWSPGERMYRTGDLVRIRPDGLFDYLGRADDQVKIRGYRVETAEVERAVTNCDAVAGAVVRAVEIGAGTRALAAYVVPRDAAAGEDHSALFGSIRDELAAVLPEYMVPTLFAALERVPMTINGKLDVRALPAVDAAGGGTFVPPRTPVETMLCEIVEAVLGVGRVGIDDDFFALGGDSITSLAVASRARKASIPLAPREVMRKRTVRMFGAELVTDDSARPAVSAAAVTVDLSQDELDEFESSI
ncbi:non-ribosomal peptide synthetase [Rhodococcus sp. 05-339-2]|uniref:non-ribosomal peptide synthetase n=1 Tax=Rhodococcoides fascians TaxID=1828 RepID=UPI00050BDDBF|nr:MULTISPECIES: non-ribosomal peptide synthetase [Rhodococcus]OZD85455.1 non-ribosomal peptide synthetase [Rhodococcus sp. 05-339-2]